MPAAELVQTVNGNGFTENVINAAQQVKEWEYSGILTVFTVAEEEFLQRPVV